jgi:hypothetical protein
MGHATELERVKAAKVTHRCSWCAEKINVGSPYSRYRYFDGGDAGTVKLHPECHEVLDETVREEGYDYEFYPGENPRGCNCGHSHGCPTCEERKHKAPAQQADDSQKATTKEKFDCCDGECPVCMSEGQI